MSKQMIVADIISVWDELSYSQKLHYVYGYIAEDELTEDFKFGLEDQTTEELVDSLKYVVSLTESK